MIDWDEVKREDMEADVMPEKIVCDNCGEEIDEGEAYYDIEETKICTVCLCGFKKYA